jgi:hypothetical protein
VGLNCFLEGPCGAGVYEKGAIQNVWSDSSLGLAKNRFVIVSHRNSWIEKLPREGEDKVSEN